jgi:hypothetical protein
MARFEINRPITTREATVTVDAGLAAGRHRFRLDVIDAQGRRSQTPGEAIVEVQRIVVDPRPPVPPIVIDPRPPVVITRPGGAPTRRTSRRSPKKKEQP